MHRVQRVVVLRVSTLKYEDFFDLQQSEVAAVSITEAHCPHFTQLFPYAWPMRLRPRHGAGSFREAFFRVPRAPGDVEVPSYAPILPRDLILPTRELLPLGYRIKVPDASWLRIEPRPLPKEPRLFALDCEMVRTYSGQALAQICVLNFAGEPIFESYVKPADPVVDYVTEYSGITEDTLTGVTTNLRDVQDWFQANISGSDVLVGHSLVYDLEALQISFPHIIDTAELFEHPSGGTHKLSLRMLAAEYLRRQIQKGHGGHDPREDALATLDLLKLKLNRGASFGLITEQKNENLLARLTRANKSSIVITQTKFPRDFPATTFLEVESDASALLQVERSYGDHDLTYVELSDSTDSAKLAAHIRRLEPGTVVMLLSPAAEHENLNLLYEKRLMCKTGWPSELNSSIKLAESKANRFPALVAALSEASHVPGYPGPTPTDTVM